MSNFKWNPGSGALHMNDKGKDTHPDRKGTFTLPVDAKEGDVFEIAGWLKTDRAGKSFLSLKVSEPRNKD